MNHIIYKLRQIVILSSLLLLISYFYFMDFDFVEFIYFTVGILLLWGPIGLAVFNLTKKYISDRVVRLAFSLSASYTLTTMIYFSLAIFDLQSLFYLAQIILLVWGIVGWNRKKLGPNEQLRNSEGMWGWVIILLIAIGFLVNIPYKKSFIYDSEKDVHTYVIFGDHLYHTGQSYELSRNIQATQQMTRSGTPERAYHNFPHVTTMLISRYTLQDNMLRAHIVYHYTVIEIFICLLLFSFGKTLTNSRWAGMVSLCVMYLCAFQWPVLNGVTQKIFFYFTVFPHRTSGLEPVMSSSPQMYSGLVVLYGILLGMSIISINFHKKQIQSFFILSITALMIAATLRFRVHFFLVMLPGFMLIMLYTWFKSKQKKYVMALCVALVTSFLIYAEMKSPIYLEGTSHLRIGYNGLSKQGAYWVSSWPYSLRCHNFLHEMIGSDQELFNWIWQVISMSAMTIFNLIGLPLLVVTLIYLLKRSERREFIVLTFFLCWLVVMSVMGAIFLTMDYDPYSVPGQLLLHIRWYLFPLYSVGALYLYRYVQNYCKWKKQTWALIFIAILLLSVTVQEFESTGKRKGKTSGTTYSRHEWDMLNYLKKNTDMNSVILSYEYLHSKPYTLPGLAGRACYLTAPGDTVDTQSLKLNPNDDRVKNVNVLWGTSSETIFREKLFDTKATHLIEFSNHPLKIGHCEMLKKIWGSPKDEVIIWEIRQADDV